MSTERLTAFKEGMERPSYMEAPFEPIFTTIEDLDGTNSEENRREFLKSKFPANKSTFVQFGLHKSDELDRNGLIQVNNDKETFSVMSRVDTRNKWSVEYRNCVGLAIIGTDPEGNKLSILSHTNPILLADKELYDEYIAALHSNIRELKSRCQTGSIDAKSFGGRAFWGAKSRIDSELTDADDYQMITEITAQVVEEVLGFAPQVAEGPRIKKSFAYEKFEQKAFLDTEAGHLHILIIGGASNSGQPFEVADLGDELDRLRVLQSKLPKRD